MENEYFQKLVEARTVKIKNILGNKAKEYAQANDRLHNFKVAAHILNTSPEQALFGMFAKHLVSIMDMLFLPNRKVLTEEFIDEKIGDAINYLILLEALFKEDFDTE